MPFQGIMVEAMATVLGVPADDVTITSIEDSSEGAVVSYTIIKDENTEAIIADSTFEESVIEEKKNSDPDLAILIDPSDCLNFLLCFFGLRGCVYRKEKLYLPEK